MKKLLLFLLIVSLVSVAAKAAVPEETFDPARLKRGLPEHAREMLRSDNHEQSLFHRLGAVLRSGVYEADKTLPAAIRSAIRILLVAAILSAFLSMSLPHTEAAVSLAGALGIAVCVSGDLNAMLLLGRRTVSELADFSKLLIPTMASAAAVSGAMTSSAAIGSLTTVLMQIFVSLLETLILPLSGAYVALCTAASALGQKSLHGLADAVGSGMKHGIRAVLFLFTSVLSLTGILSEASDISAMRAFKLTVSSSVPVAGSVLSDAASSVLAGAGVVLQSIGAIGLLGVLSIVIVPFLRLGVQYLLLQFAGFCCNALGATQCGKLVSDFSVAMSCLLAVTAGCAVMVFVSCVCLIRLRIA